MKAEISGFDPKKFVAEKFVKKHHYKMLTPGRYIRFNYGVREECYSQMIGRIENEPVKYKSGVGLGVRCFDGWHCVEISRIHKIYLDKTSGKITENRILSGSTDAGLLDAAVDRVIAKVKSSLKEIEIDDDKHDTVIKYARCVNFKGPAGEADLVIEGIDSTHIILVPTKDGERRTSFGISKRDRWVNTPQIHARIAMVCAGKQL